MAATALGVAAVAGGAVILHVLSGPARINLSANSDHASHQHHARAMARWKFSTLDNGTDPTFNQLLGINNRGQIAGYYGSGAKGHPNRGYLLIMSRMGLRYASQNVPGAAQTQVTGLNDRGVTVGFWSGQNTASQVNDNFGFYAWRGRFGTVSFPTRNNASPQVDQLLGVNDRDVAVGFYANAQGRNRGYEYNLRTRRFRRVVIPGAVMRSGKVSLTAAAINNRGDVAGFYTAPGGVAGAFLKTAGGRLTRLAYPGASTTQAFGVNDRREVVGSYTTGSGGSAKTCGFTWTHAGGFRSVSDPMGRGTTMINGVNDAGDLVGFYTDASGNTHGLLWASRRHQAPAPMPSMSASPTMSAPPSMSARPSMSASQTMAPAPSSSAPMAPAPPTSAPAPVSSSPPPGGPW